MSPLQRTLLAHARTLLDLQRDLATELQTQQAHGQVLLRIHTLLSTHTDALLAYLRTVAPDGAAIVARLVWEHRDGPG
jgi:hypothetical protein